MCIRDRRPFGKRLEHLAGLGRADALQDFDGAIGTQAFALENLSLIHISEPTRLLSISYAVFCLKKKKKYFFFFFLMIRRPPRSTLDRSSAASDVYKRQLQDFDGAIGTQAFALEN